MWATLAKSESSNSSAEALMLAVTVENTNHKAAQM
jgi:hypothetical protein